MIKQLRTKYQLSILLLLGAVSILGVLPFAVIRYFQGNLIAAVIDLSLVIGIITLVGYAFQSKKTRIASAIAAIFINSSVVLVVINNGIDSFLWIYPVFASTYFLVKPLEATGLNAMAGAVLIALSDIFQIIPLNSFIVTILMLLMSSFVYANRSEKQFCLLEKLNTIDALTGALNRRALSSDIKSAISHAEHNDAQPLLVLMDLDHFKSVNDQYGHAVGDQVLKDTVAIIKAHIRKYDKIYRFGGEEFVLLIANIEPQQQQSFIHNLQTAIKDELKISDEKPVTISFGIAAWKPNTTEDNWLKRADEVLYLAKARGRNCAIFCDTSPKPSVQ